MIVIEKLWKSVDGACSLLQSIGNEKSFVDVNYLYYRELAESRWNCHVQSSVCRSSKKLVLILSPKMQSLASPRNSSRFQTAPF